jgi:hypothetical protein
MRIAFLISTENGIVFDQQWREWLEFVPKHRYFVAVHARQPNSLHPGSFAADNLVDVNITTAVTNNASDDDYARQRDTYDVQRLLLRKTMQETEEVTHFVMCDSDSLPIKSFESVCAYLARTSHGGQYSLIQFCPHKIRTEAGRKIQHMNLVKYVHAMRTYPEFAKDIPVTHWYWNSKFVIFCRAHVQTIIDDDTMCAMMPRYGITNVGTHLPMLILSQEHGDELVNVPTTFESWNQDGSVRIFEKIHGDIADSLKFENLLFATGFTPTSGIVDRLQEMWDGTPVVDPATGERAQYTGL